MEDEIIYGPKPLPPKVTEVQPLDDYRLHIRFENGELRLMDMKPFMFGVFKRLEDSEFFNQVKVLEGWGGIVWSGELDLSPGMLRHESKLIQKDEQKEKEYKQKIKFKIEYLLEIPEDEVSETYSVNMYPTFKEIIVAYAWHTKQSQREVVEAGLQALFKGKKRKELKTALFEYHKKKQG